MSPMHILFLDDSMQASRRPGMGKVCSVGGILVPDDKLQVLKNRFNHTKEWLNIPDDCEVKWSIGGKGSHSNFLRSLEGDARQSLYTGLVQTVSAAECKVVVASLDLDGTGLDATTASSRALEFVLERATNYLKPRSSFGIVVMDKPGGGHSSDTKLLTTTYETIKQGTGYVNFTQFPMTPVTTYSHLEPGLQIADVVVGITTVMVVGNYQYAKEPFSNIKQLMLTNNTGQIGAVGLKLYPDSLINLYHHVLGENKHDRLSQGLSFDLPLASLPHGVDVP
jgi:hypothetical protein